MDWFKSSLHYSLWEDKEKRSDKNGKREEKLLLPYCFAIITPDFCVDIQFL